MLKTILLPPSNYVITYYQTLEEVNWQLREEKLNKANVFKKLEKQILSKISLIRNVKLLKAIPLTLTTKQ